MSADPRVLSSLDALGIDYEVMPCDPDLADTAAFCAAYGVPPSQSANTIVVVSKRPPGRYTACVVLATTRLDVNRRVCGLLDVRKASFASPQETIDLTGMTIGGVTPFGLPDEIPVWVDSADMDVPWVVLGAGSRTAKIRIAPTALRLLRQVEVVDGLAQAQA